MRSAARPAASFVFAKLGHPICRWGEGHFRLRCFSLQTQWAESCRWSQLSAFTLSPQCGRSDAGFRRVAREGPLFSLHCNKRSEVRSVTKVPSLPSYDEKRRSGLSASETLLRDSANARDPPSWPHWTPSVSKFAVAANGGFVRTAVTSASCRESPDRARSSHSWAHWLRLRNIEFNPKCSGHIWL